MPPGMTVNEAAGSAQAVTTVAIGGPDGPDSLESTQNKVESALQTMVALADALAKIATDGGADAAAMTYGASVLLTVGINGYHAAQDLSIVGSALADLKDLKKVGLVCNCRTNLGETGGKECVSCEDICDWLVVKYERRQWYNSVSSGGAKRQISAVKGFANGYVKWMHEVAAADVALPAKAINMAIYGVVGGAATVTVGTIAVATTTTSMAVGQGATKARRLWRGAAKKLGVMNTRREKHAERLWERASRPDDEGGKQSFCPVARALVEIILTQGHAEDFKAKNGEKHGAIIDEVMKSALKRSMSSYPQTA